MRCKRSAAPTPTNCQDEGSIFGKALHSRRRPDALRQLLSFGAEVIRYRARGRLLRYCAQIEICVDHVVRGSHATFAAR